ncbi:MAG: archease [Anaerolineae bacterium]
MGRWEEVEHTADVAVRVWGDDLRDLFATAAGAMFSLAAVAGEGEPVVQSVDLSTLDLETLLVDWLNELLYLHERERAVFTSFEFNALSETRLKATVVGRPVRAYQAHIKATTFHNLEVIRRPGGYVTEIVFDI